MTSQDEDELPWWMWLCFPDWKIAEWLVNKAEEE